jgi:hypothetical protein
VPFGYLRVAARAACVMVESGKIARHPAVRAQWEAESEARAAEPLGRLQLR